MGLSSAVKRTILIFVLAIVLFAGGCILYFVVKPAIMPDDSDNGTIDFNFPTNGNIIERVESGAADTWPSKPIK